MLVAAAAVGLLAVGCAGPEQKLGRGLRNVSEFARLGEMNRSIEQSGVWEGERHAYTTGMIRGINRSFARTAYGAFEIATFMFPTNPDGSYDAMFTPTSKIYPDITVRNYSEPFGGMALTEDPVYPDSYKPGLPAGPIWDTDTAIGFSSGDAAPFFPGSRFSVFND
jgi:putative exosortase-associated protein (TIGR04073 family)